MILEGRTIASIRRHHEGPDRRVAKAGISILNLQLVPSDARAVTIVLGLVTSTLRAASSIREQFSAATACDAKKIHPEHIHRTPKTQIAIL